MLSKFDGGKYEQTVVFFAHDAMIVAGTSPLISIDLGKDEPGMTLQLFVVKSSGEITPWTVRL